MRNDSCNQGESSDRPLADRLRQTLNAARGNLQIRERLKGIIADPNRFEPILRELGPQHALVRDLLAMTRQGEPTPGRAA